MPGCRRDRAKAGMSFIATIKGALEEAGVRPDSVLLAGVSGGADSVALLYVLHFLSRRIGFSLAAAHLNHGTRGADSDGDAEFVRMLCWRLGVPCFTVEENVPEQARRKGISVEMAAREARHRLFYEAGRKVHADFTVLAHHADDQAETLLLRLIRGAGRGGLGGMSPLQQVNGLRLLRPMLLLSHADAVGFMERHNLAWREDASNTDVTIPRNFVRQELLPLLERRLNPSVRETLVRTMELLRDEDCWLDDMAEVYLRSVASSNRAFLYAERLSQYPLAAQRRVLCRWLSGRGVDPASLDFMLISRAVALLEDCRGSRYVPVDGRRRIVNQYGKIRLTEAEAEKVAGFSVFIDLNSDIWIPAQRLAVRAVKGRGLLKDRTDSPGLLPACAALSLEKLDGRRLRVRAPREGDRMKPLGVRGTRKLQDVFTDLKVPREERGKVPVFECEGEIVWVPGYRIAAGWELKNKNEPALHLYAARRGAAESG